MRVVFWTFLDLLAYWHILVNLDALFGVVCLIKREIGSLFYDFILTLVFLEVPVLKDFVYFARADLRG
jgi:hypothetical protein